MDASHMDDHDLLVRLDQKLDGVQETVNEMRETLTHKADIDRVARLEARADLEFASLHKEQASVDKKLYMIIGGVAALEFVLNLVSHLPH